MAKRYEKLFSLSPDLYTEGSPVYIEGGALLRDTITGRLYAQLKLKNLQAVPIKAVTVSLQTLDAAEIDLEETVDYHYLDLNAWYADDFGQETPVPLKNPVVRSFRASVKEVIFADNSIWFGTDRPWKRLPKKQRLSAYLNDKEMLVQYMLTVGSENTTYQPMRAKDLFLCTCGYWSQYEEKVCPHCKKDFDRLLSVDLGEMELRKNARLAAQREKQEQEEKAFRKRRFAAGISAAAVLLLLGGTYTTTYFLARKTANEGNNTSISKYLIAKSITELHDPALVKYSDAALAAEEGNLNKAVSLYLKLGDYRDSAHLYRELNIGLVVEKVKAECEAKKYYTVLEICTKYKEEGDEKTYTACIDTLMAHGAKYLDAGDYDSAEEVFAFVADNFEDYPHEEVKQQLNETKYRRADQLLLNGKTNDALALFTELSDIGYRDADTHVLKIRYKLAEDLYNKGQLESAMETFQQLGDYSDSVKRSDDIRYELAVYHMNRGQDGLVKAIGYLKYLSAKGYTGAGAQLKEAYRKATYQYALLQVSGLDMVTYWESEYHATKDAIDYDYFLLSLHNRYSEACEKSQNALYPNYTYAGYSGYFSDLQSFYDALNASRFSSLCRNRCYDYLRLMGNWSGSGYYFKCYMEGDEMRIQYNLPWFDFGTHFKLFNQKITLYTANEKSSKDLFRITFISDTEAKFYCLKNGKSYTLKKQ